MMKGLALIGSILMSALVTGSASRNTYAAEFIRLTGHACKPYKASQLYILGVLVGSRRRPCVYYEDNTVLVASGMFQPDLLPIPVVMIRSKKKVSSTLLVFLVGGPGQALLPDTPDDPLFTFFESLANSGNDIVLLGYSGTKYSTSFPNSDLDVAVDQVKRYLGLAERQRGNRRLALAGASAGSYVAYLSGREFEGLPVVLLSPPLDSPKELVRLASTTASGNAYYQQTVTLYATSPPGQSNRRSVTISERTRTELFFGSAFDKSITDLVLENLPQSRPCTIAIVGTDDTKIGMSPDSIDKLSQQITTTLMPKMGHGPRDAAQSASLAAAVNQAVARPSCLQARKWSPEVR